MRRFLTARWQHLALLNFDVEPELLRPLLPAGLELDSWQGRTLMSVVGFLFCDVHVWGAPLPVCRSFEEVNLRFYVRRRMADGWRRGVMFVKELVPCWLVAQTARLLYGENYVALPMRRVVNRAAGEVEYSWRAGGQAGRLRLAAAGPAALPEEDTLPFFIVEHYWGYSRQRGRTLEYRVEHPRWQVAAATPVAWTCDVAALYGERFAAALQHPTSAFLAAGSEVAVYRGSEMVRW